MRERRQVIFGGVLGLALLLPGCGSTEAEPDASTPGEHESPDGGRTTTPPGASDGGAEPDGGALECRALDEPCVVDDDCCFHADPPSPMVYYFCGEEQTCERSTIPY
jgi:hypothetical protein